MLAENGLTEFTTISLTNETPASSERRSGQRYMSVLQAGKIITDSMQELCLIRNLSSRGVMAVIFAPVKVGTRIQIEFKAGARVKGTVRWVKEDRAGIEFEEEIDIHALLAPSAGPMTPRAPRLSIDGNAKILLGGDHDYVKVIDISQGGMKVTCPRHWDVGEDVVVEIEGLPIRASVIRWIREGQAGISFNRVMPLEQVAFWAARQDGSPNDTSAFRAED